MAGLREEGEPGSRKVLLQKQARLDAGVVFIAADDQSRSQHRPDRLGQRVDRGPAALKAAHGVRGALGVVARQRSIEICVPARVLDQEGDSRWRFARYLCDFDRAEFFELVGRFATLLSPDIQMFEV